MTWLSGIAIAVAAVCSGTSVACGTWLAFKRKQRTDRRAAALRAISAQGAGGSGEAQDRRISDGSCMQFMRQLTMRLAVGAATPLSQSVRAGRAAATRRGRFFEQHARIAGCEDAISVEGFSEASVRLALAGGCAGALLGVLMSNELAVLFGCAGTAFGFVLPRRVLVREETLRGLEAGQHLSEMLEVVALGLRSGLTFDRSFELYGQHFDSAFAKSCEAVYRRWSLGLSTREEALRLLADSYACDQLGRIVESIIRSLKLGSALMEPLEEFAEQARLTYRTTLEERVAKAPVKMMLPTGTLILPAMLLLVMGPILLELTQGF